jgi:hypothetical protein
MGNCSVETCPKPASRKTARLCEAHYYQLRRHGRITSPEIKPYVRGRIKPIVIKPPRGEFCKEPGCGKPRATRGWCAMHYTRWRRHGDPAFRAPTCAELPPVLGASNPRWRGDDVGYSAVHSRLRSHRGSAADHSCQQCGGQAAHWAYDHADPAERYDPAAGPYSTDSDHYVPMCVPCHKRLDIEHLATMRGQH